MENHNLKIARIRHFYEFEAINIVTHKEEITFYYDGWQTDKLQYFTNDFREFLQVFDFNGEQLQFHEELSEYFDIEYSKPDPPGEISRNHPGDEGNRGYKLIIDFPKNRPLIQDDFRTIVLEERIDFPKKRPGSPLTLNVPFDEAAHTYLYIKKLPQYDAKIDKVFFSRKDLIDNPDTLPDFFELEESEEKEYLDSFEKKSFYGITSTIPIPQCNILVGITYKPRFKDWSWLYSGILLGLFTFGLNLLLITNHLSDSLTQITSISTIAITYLVVIKGWVFMKDIDDVAGLIPFAIDLPIKIRFSMVYLLLVLLIFSELILAFYYGINPFNREMTWKNVIYTYQNIFILS